MCFVIVYSYIKNASSFSHGCHHSRECDRPKGLCDHLPEGKSNSLLRVNLPCKLLTITKKIYGCLYFDDGVQKTEDPS